MQSSKKASSKSGLVGKLMNILLPLMMGFAVAFYISGVLSYELVVNASVNGTSVGYVQSGSTFAHAKIAVKDDICEMADAPYNGDFKITYDFKLAKDPEFLTYDDCYDFLWSCVEEDYTMAYMLYVDGKQAAANENREELNALIADIKDELLESGDGRFSLVRIQNELKIEKQLCQNSMLKSIDEIDHILNPIVDKVSDEQEVAPETDDMPTIVRVAAFTSAAPAVADDAVLYDPDIDYGLNRSMVSDSESSNSLTLDYNFIKTVSENEVIPFETEYIEDFNTFVGTDVELTSGANGMKIVNYELSYDGEGNLVERKAISERVIVEARSRVVKVGAKIIPEAVPTGTFIWPCATPRGISSGYGWRTAYGVTEFHLGIDLPDEINSPIYASDGGEVVWAGYTPSYGNSIRIRHANGYETVYAHLNKILVSIGDEVYQGQHIGKMGNTGVSYGSHLHFEVRIDNVTDDPLNHLPKK